MANKVKENGQYFTVNEELQTFVHDHIRNKDCKLLEPSFGAGHLLKRILDKTPEYPMVAVELDSTVNSIVKFNQQQTVLYMDFLSYTTQEKFKTIIGNPPYVKKTPKNLYLQFIEKCFSMLSPEDGEMIMIVPSDFLKSTQGSKIIKTMLSKGSFTDFLIKDTESLFAGANVHVVCFRFQMGIFTNRVKLNGETVNYLSNDGIITFTREETTDDLIYVKDLFDVYVGMVSGKDEVYKHDNGNIEILMDKDTLVKFIYKEKLEEDELSNHLIKNKDVLIERKIRTFNETNWFQWGAPRNKKIMEEHIDKPCIYMKTLTRANEVAFVGKVQYFGGSLLCMIPKTNIDLPSYANWLNNDNFKRDYLYAGRFKIGHRQLMNSILKQG